MSLSRRVITTGLAVIVIVAGLAGCVILRVQTHDLTDSEDAGRDATRVARSTVPQILGYTGSDLAKDLESHRQLMTSDYAPRYEAMVRSRVLPQATKFSVSNELDVVSTGVVRASKNEVVVLIFANQTTRTKAQTEGVTQGTRLEVTLRRQDETWLLDDIRPL